MKITTQTIYERWNKHKNANDRIVYYIIAYVAQFKLKHHRPRMIITLSQFCRNINCFIRTIIQNIRIYYFSNSIETLCSLIWMRRHMCHILSQTSASHSSPNTLFRTSNMKDRMFSRAFSSTQWQAMLSHWEERQFDFVVDSRNRGKTFFPQIIRNFLSAVILPTVILPQNSCSAADQSVRRFSTHVVSHIIPSEFYASHILLEN